MKVTAAQGKVLLGWARAELRRELGGPTVPRPSDPWHEVTGASFVTLRWADDDRLQGCIGTIQPHMAIVDDVSHNAIAAGVHDPRAERLVLADVDSLDVELSLLSPLERLTFTDRASACAALRVGVDGLVFSSSSGLRRSTLLPSMWPRLRTPDAFLSTLLQKAGWPPQAWPEDAALWRYDVDKHVDLAFAREGLVTRAGDGHPARYWHATSDGRIQCDLCPRDCRLADGQRGFCFVRERQGDGMVLTTYGRSSGFAIDPIEKKPLNHFHPGTSVLSFGTAGCNLACRFCQNWDISKSRDMDSLAARAGPETIARTAQEQGCTSVAFTYNDPVIFAEYAMDVADACHALGIQTVAVTAGYMHEGPRREFYEKIDAANVDLKAFTEAFYEKQTASQLAPVKETLEYLVKETRVWTEITTLLIPGLNDSEREIAELSAWVAGTLGPDVPLHFSAFHADYRMTDRPPTPPSTLRAARDIARREGLRHVYTGNVHDRTGDTTFCPSCGAEVIVRDWYEILASSIDHGACAACGTAIAGRFGDRVGSFGRRRLRVSLG